MGVSGNVKSFLGRVELFKINKIFENTLSLRVAGNGTKKPVATNVASAFLVPTAPQCFLKLLSILNNSIYAMNEFFNYRMVYKYFTSRRRWCIVSKFRFCNRIYIFNALCS